MRELKRPASERGARGRGCRGKPRKEKNMSDPADLGREARGETSRKKKVWFPAWAAGRARPLHPAPRRPCSAGRRTSWRGRSPTEWGCTGIGSPIFPWPGVCSRERASFKFTAGPIGTGRRCIRCCSPRPASLNTGIPDTNHGNGNGAAMRLAGQSHAPLASIAGYSGGQDTKGSPPVPTRPSSARRLRAATM